MPQGPVGVDEGFNPGRQAAIGDCSRREFGGGCFAVLFALGESQLKSLKEGRPISVHGLGIGAPTFVVIIDQILAPPGGKSTHMQWLGWCPFGYGDRTPDQGDISVREESHFRK
jgi:hypothetical protein